MTPTPAALPDVSTLTVALLGGTGDQGRGLAYRLARSGQRILIGSRTAEHGEAAAADIAARRGVVADVVSGGTNAAVCAAADVVIVAVPWEGHAATLTDLASLLAGRIVVDCVNPIAFDGDGPLALAVPEGSAAQQAAALVPGARVCAAFHHVSAALMLDPDVDRIEQDVLVLGDDRSAVDAVRALAERIDGVRGVFAGRLRNAHQVEALTANLIAINKRYRVHAGLRITDL